MFGEENNLSYIFIVSHQTLFGELMIKKSDSRNRVIQGEMVFFQIFVISLDFAKQLRASKGPVLKF